MRGVRLRAWFYRRAGEKLLTGITKHPGLDGTVSNTKEGVKKSLVKPLTESLPYRSSPEAQKEYIEGLSRPLPAPP